MTYSKEILTRARQRLEKAREDRQSLLTAREQEIYEKLPRVRELDKQLSGSMAKAVQAAFAKGTDAREVLEKLKAQNMALQAERKALIAAHFPAEYLDDGPICPHCEGMGYIGTQMCSCLQTLCQEELKKTISLFAAGEHTFADFRLEYYPDVRERINPRAIMSRTSDVCRRYAAEFTPNSGNLLFNGGTGLGKTFLSACIARQVAEKGYSVAYESAPRLFAKLEKDHFRPDEHSAREVAELYQSTLLIIDDLGTELTGSFTISALYALVNDRLLTGKPTIISTNLNMNEIRQRYSPQIASRLEGGYQLLPFVGQDIRVLKNK
ncbi:MAG: ATP-binding protein [Oscillospiraceae bacterium]|nr:ATP-binding protein [Oscillospiraceae bacterium]